MAAQTYMSRRRTEDRASAPAPAPQAQGPSLQALRAGASPTREQLGSKVDLPSAIREKMENSFGADLSSIQLYESQTVADAGAQAMTMGSQIAFAPGQLDLASTAGQSLLGHELSHVVTQARGEAAGNGFLNDRALEARADQEGALAAAGESVYNGPVTPLSASSVSGAAGPMQAKKNKDKEETLSFQPSTVFAPSPGTGSGPLPDVGDDVREEAQTDVRYDGGVRQHDKFEEQMNSAFGSAGKKGKAKMIKNLNKDPMLKKHLIASLPYADGGGPNANNATFRSQMFSTFAGDDEGAKTAILAQQVKMLQKHFNPFAPGGSASDFSQLNGMDDQSDRGALIDLRHNDDLLNMMQSMGGLLNATGEDQNPRYSNEQLGLSGQEDRDALQANIQDYLTSAKDAHIYAQKVMGQETGDKRSLDEMKQDRYKRRVERFFRLAKPESLQHYASKEQFLQAGSSPEQEKELDEMLHFHQTVDSIRSKYNIQRKAGKKDEEIQLPGAYMDFMRKHNLPIPPR